MRRRKANLTVLPWLSAHPEGKEPRFVQVGKSLLLNDAFQNLTPGARYLYICMAMESRGKRRFQFPQSVAQKYGIPHTSLRRHVAEIRDAGMITYTSMKNLRLPNEYEFSFAWKGLPPKPPP